MKNKNLYEILGLTQKATKEEIKIAYRKHVLIYHPDVNKTPEAEKYFKLLNNAVETLLDDDKRRQYDLLTGLSGGGATDGNFNTDKKEEKAKKSEKTENEKNENSPKNGANTAKTPASTSKTSDFKQFYKNINLKNAYKNTFDDDETGANDDKHPKTDGKDIEVTATISETEAKQGTVRKINVLHTDKCPKCLGRKYLNGTICPACGGAGEKSEHKKMNVKIPAGIKSGTKLKIKNEGEFGKFGGKNGDLYLLIEIALEKNEKKNCEQIVIEVPISPWQAVLGDEIEVKTGEFNQKITIPPLTKSMTRFKLERKANSDDENAKNPEYIVVLRIDIDPEMTDLERDLYQKLKNIAKNSD